MKIRFLIPVLLSMAFSLKADYDPAKLYELILSADKIVYGEITEMDSLTYTLQIEGNLTDKEKSIKVLRFYDWPRAWRWTEYKVGQKLFLFLKKYTGDSKKYKQHYYSLSAGNEGELPLADSAVFINARSLNSLRGVFPEKVRKDYAKKYNTLLSEKYCIYEAEYYGYKMDLVSFIATVTIIKNCVELEYGDYRTISKVTFICEDSANQMANNEILKWVYKDLINTKELLESKN